MHAGLNCGVCKKPGHLHRLSGVRGGDKSDASEKKRKQEHVPPPPPRVARHCLSLSACEMEADPAGLYRAGPLPREEAGPDGPGHPAHPGMSPFFCGSQFGGVMWPLFLQLLQVRSHISQLSAGENGLGLSRVGGAVENVRGSGVWSDVGQPRAQMRKKRNPERTRYGRV